MYMNYVCRDFFLWVKDGHEFHQMNHSQTLINLQYRFRENWMNEDLRLSKPHNNPIIILLAEWYQYHIIYAIIW